MSLPSRLLCFVIRGYQVIISPMLTAVFGPAGLGCRYHPTCSSYAMQAVQRHGWLRGSILAGQRLCRCHPWGGCGVDPVPDHPEDPPVPHSSHIPGRTI